MAITSRIQALPHLLANHVAEEDGDVRPALWKFVLGLSLSAK